ncbi:MAG: universal stress protein [Paenibacillaceae bacterium]
MFSKILVAFDGSDQSKKAMEYAIQLSKTYSSQLEVVHVTYYSGFILGEALISAPAHILLEQQDYSSLIVAEANKSIESIPGAKVTLLQGSPAKVIIDFAEENNSELIIIGSRGLGGISEFVLGSVSHNVVQHSNIPVLVVK